MSLYKFFKTDAKAEAEGNLFTLQGPDTLPVFRIRLRRFGGANKLFDTVRERVFAPYRRILNDMEPEAKEQLNRKVFAEAVTVPGTCEMYVREGMKCEGSTYAKNEKGDLEWSPSKPRGCSADGFIRGIVNEHDEVIPDTIENLVEVFRALPEVYAILLLESASVDSYRQDELEQDSKN